jgi:hypothetical protein
VNEHILHLQSSGTSGGMKFISSGWSQVIIWGATSERDKPPAQKRVAMDREAGGLPVVLLADGGGAVAACQLGSLDGECDSRFQRVHLGGST